MSDERRKQHGKNQSHWGKWITDENGSQWYVCSTQKQETQKKTKKLGGIPPGKKLTLLIPEDGCGGDDPQEGFLMKGLRTPAAPRPSAKQKCYTNSSQLSTFRSIYTRKSWEKHIEMIYDCVQNGTLHQDSLNEEEFQDAYKFASGR
jgi:hypothetical protein